MSITDELLAELRAAIARNGYNPTGYRIAKVLGTTTSRVAGWTRGRAGMANDAVVRAVDYIYGPDAEAQREHWLCRRAAELESDAETRGVWEYMARQYAAIAKRATAALLPLCVAVSLSSPDLHIMLNRVRRWLAGFFRPAVLASAVLATGCASMPTHELAWQGMHALDFAQTMNGPASDPCFSEADPLAVAVIGEHPSQGDVIGYFLASSALHYAAARWLDQTELVPASWKRAIRAVDLSVKFVVIADNHREGIRPFGDNAHRCSLR